MSAQRATVGVTAVEKVAVKAAEVRVPFLHPSLIAAAIGWRASLRLRNRC
jgi:hypothetical protein